MKNRGHLQMARSGNPGGRPIGSKTFAIRELIAEALVSHSSITVSGRSQ